MEDELIKYETAKLAKEKGFDLKCKKTYYSWLGCYSILDNEDFVSNEECEKLAKEDSINLDTWLTAPTQSLLQRWLREKYDIHVDVKIDIVLNIERRKYGNRVFKFPEKTIDVPLFFYHWETYEKALEAGLQQALKLI